MSEPSAGEPLYVERLRDGLYVTGTPHSRALGMQMVSVEPGAGCLKVPWREDLTEDAARTVMASGVVTAMLDHVGGLAVLAALTEPRFTATMDLRIDTLRAPSPHKDVHAQAHCLRIRDRVAFVTASAYEDDPDDPIAVAQGSFAITPAFGAPGGASE